MRPCGQKEFPILLVEILIYNRLLEIPLSKFQKQPKYEM